LKGSISLCGSSVGGLLSGDPERYGEEGSGDGHHPMGVHSLGTLIVVRGVWKWGISLSMGALLGEPGGGAPLLGALKVMKGRLWGWASLFMGFSWGTWSGLIYQGL